jgi:DNA-binding NtrC family response regulator
LVEVLSEELALRSAVPQPEFQGQAVALLSAQPWRGNVRELRNVIEQLLLRCESGFVDASAVEAVLRESGLSQIVPARVDPVVSDPMNMMHSAADPTVERWPLAPRIRALEVQAVQDALNQTRGNKVAAAHLLGISRAKLYQCLL